MRQGFETKSGWVFVAERPGYVAIGLPFWLGLARAGSRWTLNGLENFSSPLRVDRKQLRFEPANLAYRLDHC